MSQNELIILSKEGLRLAKLIGHYANYLEICAEHIRPQSTDLNEMNRQYTIACDEWVRNPLRVTPPSGDREAFNRFFEACDKVIASEPTCIQDWYQIQFTCFAAEQVLVDQPLKNNLPQLAERARVTGVVGEIVLDERMKRQQIN